jgi:hypothetical protein
LPTMSLDRWMEQGEAWNALCMIENHCLKTAHDGSFSPWRRAEMGWARAGHAWEQMYDTTRVLKLASPAQA